AAEPVRLGVAPVLGEGVGGEAEVREDGEEALGDRLAALVAEDLPGAEVLQEVAVLGGALGHGAVPLAGGARRRQPPPRAQTFSRLRAITTRCTPSTRHVSSTASRSPPSPRGTSRFMSPISHALRATSPGKRCSSSQRAATGMMSVAKRRAGCSRRTCSGVSRTPASSSTAGGRLRPDARPARGPHLGHPPPLHLGDGEVIPLD